MWCIFFSCCYKKTNPKKCTVCLCLKKLKCIHICEECNYIMKKYYHYPDCPYCLQIIEEPSKCITNPLTL